MPSFVKRNNCCQEQVKKCLLLCFWTLLLVCIPGILADFKCGRPGRAADNDYTPQEKEFKENQVIRYKCKENDKVIFRNFERQCLNNGTWSNEIPVCSKLAKVQDVELRPLGIDEQDKRRTIDGNKSTCSEINQTGWSGILNTSTNISAVRISLLGTESLAVNVTTQDESSQENCRYMMEHSELAEKSIRTFTFYCPEKNTGRYLHITFIGQTFKICEVSVLLPPASKCFSPDIPLHGLGYKTNSRENSSYRFMCNEGYKLYNDAVVTCEEGNGRWSSKSTVCKEIFCNVPDSFENGYIDKTNPSYTSNKRIPYNGTIRYFCNEGYYLEGPSTARCARVDEWSFEGRKPPICKPKAKATIFSNSDDVPIKETKQSNVTHCRTIPHVTYGDLIITSSSVNSTAWLKCFEGYQPWTDDYVTCLPTGEWSSPSLRCTEIICGTSIDNKDSQGKWIPVNGSNYIQVLICPEYYHIENSPAIRQCLSNGSWSYTAAKCTGSTTFWGSNWTPTLILLAAIGVGAGTAILILCLSATFLVIRKRRQSQTNTTVFHLENTSQEEGIAHVHRRKHQSAVEHFGIVDRQTRIVSTNSRKPRSALPNLPVDADPVYAQPFETPVETKKMLVIASNKKDDLYNTHIYAEPVNSRRQTPSPVPMSMTLSRIGNDGSQTHAHVPICATTSRIGSDTRKSTIRANFGPDRRTSIPVEQSCDKKCAIYDSSSNSTLNSGQFMTEEKYQNFNEKPQFGTMTTKLEYLEFL